MLIYNKLSRINGHWNLSKILSHENDQKFKSNQQRVEVNIRYVPCVQTKRLYQFYLRFQIGNDHLVCPLEKFCIVCFVRFYYLC